MRATKEVVIGEALRVTCRELVLGEVRAWLADATAAEPDIVGDELWEGISLAELRRMCDLPADSTDRLSPSEIQQIADACKECNPHFFAFRARLLARARVLSGVLTPPPAPSSAPDMQTSGSTPTASS